MGWGWFSACELWSVRSLGLGLKCFTGRSLPAGKDWGGTDVPVGPLPFFPVQLCIRASPGPGAGSQVPEQTRFACGGQGPLAGRGGVVRLPVGAEHPGLDVDCSCALPPFPLLLLEPSPFP